VQLLGWISTLVADETYHFNSHEIQALFDQQIEGIVKKIIEEVD
jgi:hypothetical protein